MKASGESKVFLGGTCNETTWREKLKPLLKTPYFDPVVPEWTEAWVSVENEEKSQRCDLHLYVITSAMTGVYSIAEAVESAHNKTKATFFYVIPNGFSEGQLMSLQQVAAIIRRHGGWTAAAVSLKSLALVIDSHAR